MNNFLRQSRDAMPLHKVPNSAILETGLKGFADSTEDVAWLEDKKDQSARTLERQAARGEDTKRNLKHAKRLRRNRKHGCEAV